MWAITFLWKSYVQMDIHSNNRLIQADRLVMMDCYRQVMMFLGPAIHECATQLWSNNPNHTKQCRPCFPIQQPDKSKGSQYRSVFFNIGNAFLLSFFTKFQISGLFSRDLFPPLNWAFQPHSFGQCFCNQYVNLMNKSLLFNKNVNP